MPVAFSLKLVYSSMCEKKFHVYGVHIPIKCIESTHFLLMSPFPTPNFFPSSYHYILCRAKLPISPRVEMGKGNYKDDLEP